MLAVARDDFQINVLDIDTRRVVRKYSGHNNRITDMVGRNYAICNFRDLVPKFADRQVRVNSGDPDQTAPQTV